jgi:predicted ATP-dependent endonuclease of OLD family
MDKFVELSVKDFRAIKKADIALDGITVVSGINGCGKSTLSKLLYYLFDNANKYDRMVFSEGYHRMKPYIDVLTQIQTILALSVGKGTSSTLISRWLSDSIKASDNTFFAKAKELCVQFLNENEKNEKGSNLKTLTQRLRVILIKTLNMTEEATTKKLIDTLLENIERVMIEINSLTIERPFFLLRKRMEETFNATLENVTLKEYGDTVFGVDITNVPLLHYASKVAYIDTPMLIGLDDFLYDEVPDYWAELNDLLKRPAHKVDNNNINNVISKQIIGGDIFYETDILSHGGGFLYKRDDGQLFNLFECATGVKSFAVLQLLLKNLFLDESALLIIDEPEAHLHPQWIVEYARLIVLLHKIVGVKFFIASHSTDFVSAIRYISEKENCMSALSFYVAEETKDNMFSYRFLDKDIEPIFESFNKSFDKLEEYVNGGKK